VNIIQGDVLPAVRVAHAQLPADPVERWRTVIPVVEDLKAKAKELGLWNLFLSKAHYPGFGVPLTNLEVGCQVIQKYRFSTTSSCSTPSWLRLWPMPVALALRQRTALHRTLEIWVHGPVKLSNFAERSSIEVLARYGSPEQQKKWLLPLLDGKIRSAFAMTEKDGALSYYEETSRLDCDYQSHLPTPRIFGRLFDRKVMKS
jgi:acyl-CoA dehydrogenase